MPTSPSPSISSYTSQAALAAIVVVALKGLYLQVRDTYKYFKLSWIDMVSGSGLTRKWELLFERDNYCSRIVIRQPLDLRQTNFKQHFVCYLVIFSTVMIVS